MQAEVFDSTVCELGEGPLWHPKREALVWFDILEKRMHWRGARSHGTHQFSEHCSAAGWVNAETLLIASETQLFQFKTSNNTSATVCALEADQPDTRSNDGRADPQGGFWVGTMSKTAEPNAGAIYRYCKGELRRLYRNVTIPNGICFAPDGSRAYFADTLDGRILVQALDGAGWPNGAPEVLIDLRPDEDGSGGLNPDGAVTDADGNIWSAQWGSGRIACYAPNGEFLRAIEVPGRHSSCPAFGGPDLTTLYVTTARELLSPEIIAAEPQNGLTFSVEGVAQGKEEPRVLL
jgi:sugar lactone lactonase YvrE